MKIAVVTQYFYPENFVINDLCRKLSERGQEIVVYTAQPNYPSGVICTKYKRKKPYIDCYNGMKVFRIPFYPRGGASSIQLVLNYLSFIISGCIFFPKEFKNDKPDVILFFGTTPLTSIVPAIFLKVIFRKPLVAWILDLFPQCLAATGRVKSKHAIKSLEIIPLCIYPFVDVLLGQSEAYVKHFTKYKKRADIEYFPSIFEPDRLAPDTNFLPKKLVKDLNRNFSVVFAGNIGSLQDFDTVLDAAVALSKTEINIVLVGSGSKLSVVKKRITELGLSNVHLHCPLPANQMHNVFSLADCLLVTLKKDYPSIPYLSLTVPGKVQAYMASGKPIIAALAGEGARIIAEAKCGFSGAPGSSEQLAENILKLHDMKPQDRNRLGLNGMKYHKLNFDHDKHASNLISVLERTLR